MHARAIAFFHRFPKPEPSRASASSAPPAFCAYTVLSAGSHGVSVSHCRKYVSEESGDWNTFTVAPQDW